MGRNAKLRANRKKPQGFSPQRQPKARHHSDAPPPGMKFFKVGEICKALAAIAGRGAWLNVPGRPPRYILPKEVQSDPLFFSSVSTYDPDRSFCLIEPNAEGLFMLATLPCNHPMRAVGSEDMSVEDFARLILGIE